MSARPDFRQRATDAEQMDRPDCDLQTLHRTLDAFAGINRCFSRLRSPLRRWVLAPLKAHPPANRPARVLDLGCGACDVPIWLLGEAQRQRIPLEVTALDADPRVVAYARSRHGQLPGLQIVLGDATRLAAFAPVDFIIGNHFLHHLDNATVTRVLAEARQQALRGVLFTDLARSRFSYAAFSLLALPFRGSFIREDGLLSIRKGFRPSDFGPLIEAEGYAVRTACPGRVLLTLSKQG